MVYEAYACLLSQYFIELSLFTFSLQVYNTMGMCIHLLCRMRLYKSCPLVCEKYSTETNEHI